MQIPSIPIARFQFFTIRTRDLPAARRFYVDLLGFDVVSEKAGEYVQVAIAGVPVCIDADAKGSQQTNQIEVNDLQLTIQYLQERGLPLAAGSEKWASVKDPDGHEILFLTAP